VPEGDTASLSTLISSVAEQLRVARLQQEVLDRLHLLCHLAEGRKPQKARGVQPAREELSRSLGLGYSQPAVDPDDVSLNVGLPQLEEAARRLEEDGLATLDSLRDDFALQFHLYDIAVVLLLHGVQKAPTWRPQLSQAWIKALTGDIPGYTALGLEGGDAEAWKTFTPLCDHRALVAEARRACPAVADALDTSGDAFHAVSDRAFRMGTVLANILVSGPPLTEDDLIVPCAVAAAYVLQFRGSILQPPGDVYAQGPEEEGRNSLQAEVTLRLLCSIAFDNFTGALFRVKKISVDHKAMIPMMISCIKQCLWLICTGLKELSIVQKGRQGANLRQAPPAAFLDPLEADRHFNALYAKLPDSIFRSLDKRSFGHALCYLWKYLALTFMQLVGPDPFDQGGMSRLPLEEQRRGIIEFLTMLGVDDKALADGRW